MYQKLAGGIKKWLLGTYYLPMLDACTHCRSLEKFRGQRRRGGVGEKMDEWMDGWMYGWMYGWMDGWMDGWILAEWLTAFNGSV